MAKDIVSRATVNLTVNGGNSSKKLEELRARSEAIKKEITEIQSGGKTDSPRIRALRKEFEKVGQTITRCQSEIGRVTDVLARLDKASPKELRQTLNSLKRGLDSIERGSKAWESQVAMIKRVEAELKRVNATIQTTESRWTRMNRWLNDTQTFLMGAAAAVTGLVMAGRKAVNAFADMDESMTNTQKYTGLAEKKVVELNEAFKKTDTRLTREQLNLLAQEAGRLGKNTIENVEGYVDAASIINVALVDLGEGATQTIAKLANIFGVEKQLGTKQAMLSIGSAVNVLSQNCTASKPYLVDFAQRMAGIGSQAGLTVPQILAFGAVLDANGQKVEMSATAIQKIIMALANKNKEFSQVLGLDADKLAKTLNRSAKDGILMYLEAIKKLSDKTSANNATIAIAPLFKDMGMDAARVATVLSTLANHIDELKWQFGEADKAFREATSATHEFELFNNTAQASIDKAKKRVSELAIELGEKLYPIMKHIYTSSGIFLRVLKTIIDFIYQNKVAFTTATLSIVAYYTAVAVATLKTKAFAGTSVIATGAISTFKAAVLITQAALYTLIGRTDLAAVKFRALSMVLKTSPFGVAAAAATILAGVIYKLSNRVQTLEDYVNRLNESTFKWTKESVKEQRELELLIGKMQGAKEGTEEYETAKNSLISQYGQYLEGLVNEEGKIIDLEAAYDRLTRAIQRNAMAKGISEVESKIHENYAQSMSDNLTKLQNQLEHFGASAKEAAEITTKVANSMMTGEVLPDDVAERINQYSTVRSGGTSGWQKFNSWLNNSKLVSGAESVSNFLGLDLIHSEKSPAEIYNQMVYDSHALQSGMNKVETMRDAMDPDRKLDTRYLKLAIDSIKKALEAEKENEAKESDGYQYRHNITVLTVSGQNKGEMKEMTMASARDLLKKYEDMLGMRGASSKEKENPISNFEGSSEIPEYTSEKDKIKADKKAAAEAKRELLKKKQEFRDGLAAIEAAYRSKEALIVAAYSSGETDYVSYLSAKNDAEQKFCDDSRAYYEKYFAGIKDIYLEDDKTYQGYLKRKTEAEKRYQDKKASFNVDRIKKEEEFEINTITRNARVNPDQSFQSEIDLQKRIAEIRLESLRKQQREYTLGSEQWEKLQIQIFQHEREKDAELERQFQQKVNEMRTEYAKLSAAGRYKLEMQTLQLLLEQEKVKFEEYEKLKASIAEKYKQELPGGNFERTPNEIDRARRKARGEQIDKIDSAVSSGMITKEEGDRRKQQLDKEDWKEYIEAVKNGGNEWIAMIATVSDAWKDLWESLGSDSANVLDKISSATQATFAVVSAAMQMASQFAQANADIEIKKIEKRYEREAELAQGNTYLTKKLEKEKQQKVAEIKDKASEASFKMQIIQATATMITGAMNAYTSTLKIPIVGPALAPAAAAVALAAGAANLALLKKQQEASASQGYAEGGYTRRGSKYEVAGVVHAGEWVAPREMLENPVTAGVIARLDRIRASGDISALENMADFARRHDPVATLTPQDASRVAATGALSRAADIIARSQSHSFSIPDGGVTAGSASGSQQPASDNETIRRLSDVVSRLAQRLDEPFVTINTVTGDAGIKRAQDEYNRMMKNKNRRR